MTRPRAPRVLLVEDNAAHALAVSDRLRREGYDVDHVADGDQGQRLALDAPYDVLVLDVMLPGPSGLAIAESLRSRGLDVPILMLSARGEVADRVVGLSVGADDYLAKPFEFIELLARIDALLRRAGRRRDAEAVPDIAFGDVVADFRTFSVTRAGRRVKLSSREMDLLRYLATNPGAVITRDELLDEVWGSDAMPTPRTVDVHIARLRQKLEPTPATPRFILTVHGRGYRFVHTAGARDNSSQPATSP